MSYLPVGQQVLYPDGSTRTKPRDGERFMEAGKNYTWDDLLGLWVDYKGEVLKIDKDQASFFDKNPKNSRGCECGVWKTDSDRHSDWCWLYRKP